jgi:hypothetical protein
LQQDKNPALSILQFLLEKYIQNRESLLYKDNSTAAIARAIEVIRNNSSKDLVQEYIKESYSSFDDSNLSLVMSSRQKIVKIKKIEFLYSKMTYLQQLYMKFTANKLPNKAKVEFSVFTTKDEQEKNFTAYISYIFFFDEKNVKNKNLDFHVNGYRRVAE